MESGFHGFSFARKICGRKITFNALARKGCVNFINRLSQRLATAQYVLVLKVS
jgi:hypothetical protein